MAEALAATAVAETDAVASYFEVHVRRGDRWVIDCTAASADDALAEAEDIARRADVLAVKVVNERYNPRTDQTAARVIFTAAKPERKRAGDRIGLRAMPRPPQPTKTLPPAAPPILEAPTETAAPGRPASNEPAPSPAPWMLFAWASLALAVAATLLFGILLVVV
jgi:hypothetical protein